jgi:AraC family transcriptional regulator
MISALRLLSAGCQKLSVGCVLSLAKRGWRWLVLLVSKPRSARAGLPSGTHVATFTEAPAWRAVGASWRPLFGSFRSLGFSFEWHDFRTEAVLDWGRSFHPGGLELCLNLDGQATLTDTQHTVELRPRATVFYFQGAPPLAASRRAKEQHRFITVEFAAEFLKKHLRGQARHLHPCVRGVIDHSARQSVVTPPEPMGLAFLQLVESLQRCPVFKPAQETWFRCKALELAAQSFFCPPEGEFLCTRQQRAACERAARVREVLAARLADPPTLDELGRLAGCSPFYLSRQFSEATGLTIQQFLRQARLERAAELLRAGKHNVTEAALEVGYNSLSHFTVAFREVFGCCPGLYPLKVLPRPSPSLAGSTTSRTDPALPG